MSAPLSPLSLAGRTLFITGASRGIGLAIARRAAKDGANIVIAAKTAAPHPKLEGTIYSAADEIVAAGGQALALVVDVRDEAAIERAVAAAVERFGGVDICVNNASAINLTDTLTTSAKSFDLMHQVNVRATFLAARACLPHLRRSDNPHILMISPPLSLEPRWFGPHLAYSLSKFGMSLCVLGLAEEFRGEGIGVNALWPRTIIGTAAIAMRPGGGERMRHARSAEIMADAAHHILCAPARARTGAFLLDDDVLSEAGVTSFARYELDPSAPQMIDMFIPDDAPPAPAGVRLMPRE
jgi:citronellol/citronellal dehydrogenase